MAADNSVVIEANFDTSKAEKDLAKLKSKIQKTEEDIKKATEKRDAAEQKSVFDAAELDREKAKLAEMKAQLQEMQAVVKDKSFSLDMREETKAKIPIAKEEITEQQARVSMLQAAWNKTQNEIDRYNTKLQESAQSLEEQKIRAGELEQSIDKANSPAERLKRAFDGSGNGVEKLGKRIAGLARRVFVFSMITSALRALREYIGKVINTNDEARAAFARLKGSLLTLVQPIVSVVIPALTTLANMLAHVVNLIATLISKLFGKTIDQSREAAKSLYEEADGLGGVGKAAEEAAGSLASFDEINVIQTEDKSGGGGGTSQDTVPDFSGTEALSDRLKKIAELVALIGAGFALWKIGSGFDGKLGEILTTLGLIIMLIGSLVLYAYSFNDAWNNGVDWINLIGMVGGLAGAAFALYKLFGPIAAGIALIVGGLSMLVLSFKDADANGWNLKNTLLAIAGIMATGLGIALIAGPGGWIAVLIAGIASLLLAFTVATGHGQELIDGIKEVLQGFVDFFNGIFTGDIDLTIKGIEEIFDGFGLFFDAIWQGLQDVVLGFFDWLDEITGGKISGTLNALKQIFSSAFSFVSGVLSDVWNALQEVLSGIITFIVGVFTGDWNQAWEGIKQVFSGIWDGIVGIIKGGINLVITAVETFLNAIIAAINLILSGVSWIGSLFGADINLSIPPLEIPRLAQGAVIPPNREFMAVLGDQTSGNNIEAPESLIRKIVREESGGGDNSDILRSILDAIKSGHVIMVDGTVFGRTAIKSINGVNQAAGRQLLKL